MNPTGYAKAAWALISVAFFLSQQPVWCQNEKPLQDMLDKIDQPQDFPPEKLAPPQPAYPANPVARPEAYFTSYPATNSAFSGGGYGQQAPPVTPTQTVFQTPRQRSYQQRTSCMASPLQALQHSVLWRNLASTGYGGAGPGQPGGNPFNLTPFGMLHYMWDDTTYTSDANPVTLYQVQNDLQYAQQQSQLAQAAAARARYATNPQDRQQAAMQAQYYANQAQQAASRAHEESNAGSLNPEEVANAVSDAANSAQTYARQARGIAGSY